MTHKSTSGGKQLMYLVVLPIFGVIILATVLFFLGYEREASLTSTFGTSLVLFVTVIFIVFFDSRKKWPGQSAKQRFVKLITFDR